jgi:hypothetical protein
VVLPGLEPGTFSTSRRRDNRYTIRPLYTSTETISIHQQYIAHPRNNECITVTPTQRQRHNLSRKRVKESNNTHIFKSAWTATFAILRQTQRRYQPPTNHQPWAYFHTNIAHINQQSHILLVYHTIYYSDPTLMVEITHRVFFRPNFNVRDRYSAHLSMSM